MQLVYYHVKLVKKNYVPHFTIFGTSAEIIEKCFQNYSYLDFHEVFHPDAQIVFVCFKKVYEKTGIENPVALPI